jgi:integrase
MLTAKKVAALLKVPGRHRDGDVRGLYLQVATVGSGAWLLRYERGGKERMMGLGAVREFSLKEARDRARAARQQLADGVDPLDAKRADRDRRAQEAARGVTFKRCAEQYFAAHADGWSSAKYRAQFMATMRDHAFPIIGSVSVAAIDEAMVLKLLAPIWKEKVVTAKRLRNRIAAVLDYAAAAKYRTGTNPARWEGHLEHLLADPAKVAKVAHFKALPYDEVAAFIAQLRKQEGVSARALEFTILCAARTNETIGATWDEIDLNAKTWTIPAARMKANRPHRVPLSDCAVEILRALPREDGNPHVFIGPTAGTAISSIAMYRALRRLRSDVDVHGFRSTFSTWANEITGCSNHVIELSLAHTIGTAVERAYSRGDLFEKRRKLMEAWAQHCATPSGQSGAVVPMRRAP